MTIDKGRLFAFREPPSEYITLPTGDKIYFVEVSIAEGIAVQKAGKDSEGDVMVPTMAMARLVCLSARNEDGTAAFNEDDIQPMVSQMQGSLLKRLFEGAIKANGLNKDAVAEAEKNS